MDFEQDTLIKALEDLHKKGYAYVEIRLSNGEGYLIWLGDYRSIDVESYILLDSESELIMRSVGGPILFSMFKRYFEDKPTTLSTPEDRLYRKIKKIKVPPKQNPFEDYRLFRNIHKPNIIVKGEWISIDMAYVLNNTNHEKNKFNEKVSDIVINKNHILSIIPFKSDYVIDDEMFNTVIDRLVADGFLNDDGEFLKK